MTAIDKNKPSRKDRLRLVIAGVFKHYPSGSLVLAGQVVTPTEVTQAMQTDIDLIDAADKAHADWLAKVQAQRNSHQKVGPLLRALKSQVLAQFGDTQDASSTLADFGYTPRRVTKPGSATKANAAVKMRATRAARHTMGKNQQKDVTGKTTVVTPPATASPPIVASPPPGTTPAGGSAKPT